MSSIDLTFLLSRTSLCEYVGGDFSFWPIPWICVGQPFLGFWMAYGLHLSTCASRRSTYKGEDHSRALFRVPMVWDHKPPKQGVWWGTVTPPPLKAERFVQIHSGTALFKTKFENRGMESSCGTLKSLLGKNSFTMNLLKVESLLNSSVVATWRLRFMRNLNFPVARCVEAVCVNETKKSRRGQIKTFVSSFTCSKAKKKERWWWLLLLLWRVL